MASDMTPPADPTACLEGFPDDPDELTPDQRIKAVAQVLHQVERLIYALQTACETLAFTAGLSEADIRRIEREAVEEEGKAMDEAEERVAPDGA